MSGKSLRLTIRKPDQNRRSFSIVRDEKCIDSRKQSVWDNPEIDNINKLLREGTLAADQAYQLLLGLKNRELEKFYGPKLDLKFNNVNEKIVDKYLQSLLKNRTHPDNFKNISIDCDRILRILGEDSLMEIERNTIIERLNALTNKNGSIFKYSVREKILMRINSLLRLVGRESKEIDLLIQSDLATDDTSEVLSPISFITEQELKPLLKEAATCKDPQIVCDCISILFYSGMREAELFAVTAQTWSKYNGHYTVIKQRDRQWKLRDPKGSTPRLKRIRNVLVPPQIIEAFERWCNYDSKILKELRLSLSKQVRQAAKRAFPNEPGKWVSNHDLRHSAAVNYLTKGLTLTVVAGKLGHSEKICRDYYAGWISTDEEVTACNAKLSANFGELARSS